MIAEEKEFYTDLLRSRIYKSQVVKAGSSPNNLSLHILIQT